MARVGVIDVLLRGNADSLVAEARKGRREMKLLADLGAARKDLVFKAEIGMGVLKRQRDQAKQMFAEMGAAAVTTFASFKAMPAVQKLTVKANDAITPVLAQLALARAAFGKGVSLKFAVAKELVTEKLDESRRALSAWAKKNPVLVQVRAASIQTQRAVLSMSRTAPGQLAGIAARGLTGIGVPLRLIAPSLSTYKYTIAPLVNLARSSIKVGMILTQIGFAKALPYLRSLQAGAMNVTRNVATLAAGLVSAGAVAAAAAIAMGTSWVMQAEQAGDAAFKLAARLNMPTEALTGLQAQAKNDVDFAPGDFNAILEKMTKNIGEAATAGGPAKDALASIGLEARNVASMGADKQFYAIADGLKSIKNPAEQAAIAQDLFGKSGQSILPMIAAGSDALKSAVAEQLKFGAAINDIDGAKLTMVDDQFDALNTRMTGVKNTFTVAVAPVLIDLMGKLIDLIPPADRMKTALVSGMKFVGYGVALVSQGFHGLKGVIIEMTAVGVKALGGLASGFLKLVDGANALKGYVGISAAKPPAWLSNFASGNAAMEADLWSQANDQFKGGLKTSDVDVYFSDIQNKVDKTAAAIAGNKDKFSEPIIEAFTDMRDKARSALQGMKDDLAHFGLQGPDLEVAKMSDQQDKAQKDLQDRIAALNASRATGGLHPFDNRALFDPATIEAMKADRANAGAQGADTSGYTNQIRQLQEIQNLANQLKTSGGDLAQAQGLAKELNALKQKNDLLEEGKKIATETLTAQEKYEKRLDELKKIRDAGGFKDTPESYQRAITQAQKDLQEAQKKEGPGDTTQRVGATERRTPFVVLTNPDSPQPVLSGGGPLDQVAANTKKQTKQQDTQTGLLGQIITALKGGSVVKIVDISSFA